MSDSFEPLDDDYATFEPPRRSRRRWVVAGAGVAVLVVAGALVVSGLRGGGGDDDDDDNGSGGPSPAELADEQTDMMDNALDYATCMRDHGVEMNDPVAEDDGSVALPMPTDRSINPKDDLAEQPEAYRAAVEACQEILERGQSSTPVDPEELAQQRDDMAAWQDCMVDKGHQVEATVDDNGNISTRNLDTHSDRQKFQEDREACNEALDIEG